MNVMTTEVTLTLPEHVARYLLQLGRDTKRTAETALVDTLEMMLPTLPDTTSYPPIISLTDDDVVALAHSKMDETQNTRLHTLQLRGKTGKLADYERDELLALLHIYQKGQLRKAEALAEAVKRGLIPPLSD